MSTFLSRPFFDFRPDFGQEPQYELDTEFSSEKRGFGVETQWLLPDPSRKISLKFPLFGKTELRDFESFFDGIHGNLQGFWMPSWKADLRLSRNILSTDTAIRVDGAGLPSLLDGDLASTHLVLVTPSIILPLTISSVQTLGNEDVITLDASVGQDFSRDETNVCFLLYVRLDGDEISFEHVTDDICLASFSVRELSHEYGDQETGLRPVYLYRLSVEGSLYYWTSYGQTLTAGSFTWEAADISHSEIRRGSDMSDDGVKLAIGTVDTSHPLRQFLVATPSPHTVDIFQTTAPGFDVDMDAPLYTGDVTSVEFGAKGVMTANLTSLLRIGEFRVPRFLVQRTCNWKLFEPNTCKVSRPAYVTSGNVSLIDGNDLECTAFGTRSDNWLTFGFAKIGNQTRLIIGHTGTRITLNAQFTNVEVDTFIQVWPGCDKTKDTCTSKFSNVMNFGGFPHIPVFNPSLTIPQPEQQKTKKG